MVDVMGRTPEEFEEMLNAQIAEAERRVRDHARVRSCYWFRFPP